MNKSELKKQKEEKLWEAIYYNIGALYAESASEDLQDVENQEYPTRMDEWFYKHLEELKKEEKKEKRIAKFRRIAKKAAVILMVITIGFTSMVVGVEAFRIELMRLFIDVQEKYTEITFDEIESAPSELLKDFSYYYYPEYIPEEYTLTDVGAGKFKINMYFTNEKGEKISFTQTPSNTKVQFDTENAVVKDITILGMNGMYIIKNNRKTLIWHDNEKMFYIIGIIEEEELFQMAESIKYVQ